MDDRIETTNGDFLHAIEATRHAIAEVEGLVPADPVERDPVQALLGIAALMIRIELDVAAVLSETSEAIVELVDAMAAAEAVPPPSTDPPARLNGVPRVEVTAKVLSELEEALGVRRSGRPLNWSRELRRLPGSRFRPRRRRETVRAILGPGED
jgi:hypothetical protein